MKTSNCNYQLILILLLFFGCSQKEDERIRFIEASPVSIQLQEGVPLKDSIVGTPYALSLHVIDTCLIIFNSAGDNLFEIYSTRSNDKIGAFGRRGRGPGEFGRRIEMTGQVTKTETTNMPVLHVYNSDENKLHYIHLYSAITDSQYVSRSERLDVKMRTTRVIYKDDSLLYFVPLQQTNQRARFIKYNFTTQISKNISYMPDIGIPIREENINMVYYSVFAVNEQLDKIIAAPILLGQVDFFDFNGDYLQSTNFDDFKKYQDDLTAENVTNTSIKKNITEFKKGNDHIYALNKDVSYKLIREQAIPGSSKILKFDWDGNLIQEYVLDQPVTSFAYDEINERFYIFNPFNTEQSIWYYELK